MVCVGGEEMSVWVQGEGNVSVGGGVWLKENEESCVWGRESGSKLVNKYICMYIYIYIYIYRERYRCMYVCMCMFVHLYRF